MGRRARERRTLWSGSDLTQLAASRRCAARVGLGCGVATLALALPLTLAHAADVDPLTVRGAAGLALGGVAAIGAALMAALLAALGVLLLARKARRHRHG